MNWDREAFSELVRGGFGAGEEKRKQQELLQSQEDNVAKQELQEAQKTEQLAYKTTKDEELHQLKIKKEQLSLLEKLAKFLGIGQNKELLDPRGEAPSPTPTPNPMIAGLEKGFADYGLKSGFENPLATMSAQMAQAQEENPLPDPYLPATMSLMETSGGKHMKYKNNPFNYGGDKPDLNTAIQRINEGIGNTSDTGLYKDYLNSGDMQDFFKTYTPSADPANPNYDELMKRYTQLRGYFPE